MRVGAVVVLVGLLLVPVASWAEQDKGLRVPQGTFKIPDGTFKAGSFRLSAGTLAMPAGTFAVRGFRAPGGTFSPPQGDFMVPRGIFQPAAEFKPKSRTFYIGNGFSSRN